MKPHWGWRGYFFLYLAFLAAVVVMDVNNPGDYSPYTDSADYLFSAFGVLALAGYAFSRRFISRGFWRVYFWLGLGFDVFLVTYETATDPENSDIRMVVFVSVFVILLLLVPIYVALWRYAFRSEDLWKATG